MIGAVLLTLVAAAVCAIWPESRLSGWGDDEDEHGEAASELGHKLEMLRMKTAHSREMTELNLDHSERLSEAANALNELQVYAQLVTALTPAIGERAEGYDSADISRENEIVAKATECLVLACMEAVRRRASVAFRDGNEEAESS